MALSLDMKLSLTPELRQLAIRVGIGALLFAAAAYVLVGMPVLEGRKLDAATAEIKAKMERQQKLLPAMADIAASAQNATLTALMAPKAEPMPRAQAYQVSEQLSHLATASGLEPLDVTLNTASLADDPDSIQAQGVFAGQMEGVRAFLMELSRLPSLSRLERVEIRAVEGRLEMMVQLRIALGG